MYTIRRESSFFERFAKSLFGILFGIVLLIVGLGLLWWNEGDFVHTRDALREAAGTTEELEDLSHVRHELDGHLVHAIGEALANEQLRDRDFGFAVRALSLKREVEYYQWVEKSHTETRKKLGGGEEEITTYQYVGEWVDSPVSSTTFVDPEAKTRYTNSIRLDLKDTMVSARSATLGAYRLPTFLIDELPVSDLQDLNLKPADRRSLAARMHADPALIHVDGNCVYLGHSPNLPEIGDVRVHFYAAIEGTISILARTAKNSFEPYQAGNGKKIFAAEYGTLSAHELYVEKERSNVLNTWLIRVLGIVLVTFAVWLLLEPISVLASILPILGSLVEAGSLLVSLCVGLALSFAVMAIAWIAYRPLIGCALLAIGLLFAILLPFRKKLLPHTA
ncbi:MAG: TMEM43 family protein [Desulfovibrionaceae bacterium]|nr:TMEM43 family protein [Desulfovibrionaceae bacterium]